MTGARAVVLASLLALPPSLAAQAPPGTDIWIVPIAAEGGRLTLGQPRNATRRAGYDNQPWWTAASDGFLYTANTGTQTDIFRHDLRTGATVRVTDTPESEYSPREAPDGRSISVVRVELDSTQRLWRLPLDGRAPAPAPVLDVKPVGYYAWLDDRRLALFVLGAPATLQLAAAGEAEGRVVARDVGRSIYRIPGDRELVSFVQRGAEGTEGGGGGCVATLDPATGATRCLAPVRPGNEFNAWTPKGDLLTAEGSVVYRWNGSAREWEPVGDLAVAGVVGISRLAVSPDGRWLAVVANDPQGEAR